MLTTAIGYASIVWVIISWARMLIKPESIIQKYLCLKCLCFWSTLAITWEPLTAAVAALMGAVVDMYMNSQKIEL